MYSISLIGILLAIFEFGIAILSTKVISSKTGGRKDYIKYAFGLRLMSFLLVLLVLVSFYSLTSLLEYQIIVYTLLIYGFSNSLTIFFRAVFRGFEVMKYEGISIIFDRLLVIMLCGGVLLVSPSLILFVSAYSLAFLLSMSFTFYLFKRQVNDPFPSFDFGKIKNYVLKPGSVFAVMNILLIVRSKLPSLLIEYLTDSNIQVGFYNSGYRLLESYLLIPLIFITPLYPIFVRINKRKAILSKLISNTTRLILVIASFIVIPFFFFREELTLLLYGSEFLGASDTIGLIIFSTITMSLTVVFGSLVSASDKQKLANKIISIEVLIGIFLFSIGIKNFESEGAAIATLITEFLMASILIFVSRKLIDLKQIITLLSRFLLALVISSSIIYTFLDFIKTGNFFTNVSVSLLVLLITYLLTGFLSKKDFYKLFRLIPKLRGSK